MWRDRAVRLLVLLVLVLVLLYYYYRIPAKIPPPYGPGIVQGGENYRGGEIIAGEVWLGRI